MIINAMNKMFGVDCDECGKPYPKSLMVTLNGSGLFQEFSGRYCVMCYHKIAENFDFCSDCGDEYPKAHLYASLTEKKTFLCLSCLNKEEDDAI